MQEASNGTGEIAEADYTRSHFHSKKIDAPNHLHILFIVSFLPSPALFRMLQLCLPINLREICDRNATRNVYFSHPFFAFISRPL